MPLADRVDDFGTDDVEEWIAAETCHVTEWHTKGTALTTRREGAQLESHRRCRIAQRREPIDRIIDGERDGDMPQGEHTARPFERKVALGDFARTCRARCGSRIAQ